MRHSLVGQQSDLSKSGLRVPALLLRPPLLQGHTAVADPLRINRMARMQTQVPTPSDYGHQILEKECQRMQFPWELQLQSEEKEVMATFLSPRPRCPLPPALEVQHPKRSKRRKKSLASEDIPIDRRTSSVGCRRIEALGLSVPIRDQPFLVSHLELMEYLKTQDLLMDDDLERLEATVKQIENRRSMVPEKNYQSLREPRAEDRELSLSQTQHAFAPTVAPRENRRDRPLSRALSATSCKILRDIPENIPSRLDLEAPVQSLPELCVETGEQCLETLKYKYKTPWSKPATDLSLEQRGRRPSAIGHLTTLQKVLPLLPAPCTKSCMPTHSIHKRYGSIPSLPAPHSRSQALKEVREMRKRNPRPKPISLLKVPEKLILPPQLSHPSQPSILKVQSEKPILPGSDQAFRPDSSQYAAMGKEVSSRRQSAIRVMNVSTDPLFSEPKPAIIQCYSPVKASSFLGDGFGQITRLLAGRNNNLGGQSHGHRFVDWLFWGCWLVCFVWICERFW